MVTDKAPSLIPVVEELRPDACHDTERFANNGVESDHARWKARLGPRRGLPRDRTAAVAIRGHAFVQNTRPGHYKLASMPESIGYTSPPKFNELAKAV